MKKNLKNRIITSIILLLVCLTMFLNNYILIFLLLLISIFSILEFSNMIVRIFNKKILIFLSIAIFSIYLGLFSYLFFMLTLSIGTKIMLLIILFTCFGSDIGGFVFGKTFKGPKLSKISPNKTIVGSLGSFILSSLVIAVSFNLFFGVSNFSYILIVGILSSLGCQIGDLFFSYLKRKAKIKDTAGYLPGHGGFLDRIDGILLGLPIGIFTIVNF